MDAKNASGALWEVKTAKEVGNPVRGQYTSTEDRPSTPPSEFTGVRLVGLAWANIRAFLYGLWEQIDMSKRALIVGINQYDHIGSLTGCVCDANAMAEVLTRNGDGSLNFDCRLLTSPGPIPITRRCLRQQWRELFHDFREDVLFYFSGHGTPTEVGGYIVTQDGMPDDPGLAMDDIVTMANDSAARNVLLILDCCFSGSAGNPPSLQIGNAENRALLREGVTIIAASRPTDVSVEVGGHGVFTNLVLGALRGGAADVRGSVSAASIYAYAEAALGAWDQRPLYKSHAALSGVNYFFASATIISLHQRQLLFDSWAGA